MPQQLFYMHTMPGVEQIAWNELEDRFRGAVFAGIKNVPRKNALLLFRSAEDPERLLSVRCAEDLFAVAARGFKVAPSDQGLRQIYAAVRNAKETDAALDAWESVYGNLPRQMSFRVIVRVSGSGDVMRRDIGRAVSDAVLDGWPGRWRRVDENADAELWVNLLGSELLCGLRLSQAEMRHRGYGSAEHDERQHLPAALRPSVAAAMVQLTRPQANDAFLDPMAGTGTILLERAAAGPFRKLLGGDDDYEAYDALRANTRRVEGTLELRQWDARQLPLEDASVDKAALNLPFGRRVSPGENLRALYTDVFAELTRVVRPGGLVVPLTGDSAALDTALRATPSLRSEKRYPVELLGYNAVISLLRRTSSG